jgi:hypothetical protein
MVLGNVDHNPDFRSDFGEEGFGFGDLASAKKRSNRWLEQGK